VVRGGAWNDVSQDCRSARRARYATDAANVFIGLRPVRTVIQN
jgi:formylglycine-generating enzyme required for sulfatase activity